MVPAAGGVTMTAACGARLSDDTNAGGARESHGRTKGGIDVKSDDFWPGDRTDVGWDRWPIGAGLFALIAVLVGADVVEDSRSGATLSHVAVETVIAALALAGAVALWRHARAVRRRAALLRVDLEAARRDAARFREESREALRGLGDAIDRQFERWTLTPAEREVGWLLLKGLSHREIADARSTSETTIRQQALALYRKARLRNRAELSAFFLEDLFAAR
jgi:DNA-binding CsgD family transcriptional regulator